MSAFKFPERSEVFVHVLFQYRCLPRKYSGIIEQFSMFGGCRSNISWRWNSTFKIVCLRTLMAPIQMGDTVFSNFFGHKATTEMAIESGESDSETDPKVLRHTIHMEASWKHWIL